MSEPKNINTKEELPEILPDTTIISQNTLKLYAGIFCLFVAVFLSVSLFSYLFTWQEDQDKILDFNWSIIFNKNTVIENTMGTFGAIIAHLLVYELFGIAAFIIPLFLFALGFNITLDEKIFNIKRLGLFSLVWIVFLATVGAFVLHQFSFPFGGSLGESINSWLSALIGKVGLGILLVIMGLSFFGINISFLLKSIRAKFQEIKQKRKELLQKEAEKAKSIEENEEELEESLEKDSGYDLESIIPEEKELPISHVKDNTFEILNEEKKEPEIEFITTTENPISLIDISTEIIEENQNELEIISFEKEQTDDEIQLVVPEKAIIPNKPIAEKHLDLEIDEVQPFGIIEPIEDEDEEISEVETAANLENEEELIDENTNYNPKLDLSKYQYPGTNLLEDHGDGHIEINKEELEANKNQIVETLSYYNIGIEKIKATVGPTVTLYEIVPEKGVRISKIKNLEDDIALSLSALGIRIIAPIPGRGTIGIEVPNVKKSIVSMKSLLESEKFKKSDADLPIAIGRSISNEDFIIDLAKMPHMLMAGATGQGKSVGINAILISLLYKKHPSELKLVMVDPKKVELSLYKLIENHYLAKLPDEEEAIITDTKKVIHTLNALCIEMDDRYELLKAAGVRHIKEYNQKFTNRRLNPQKGHRYLPYIVLVVDEFADLMMTAGKEVEAPIARLAQLARAIGIHLVIATQRPSVNIITGTIKANFPGRIAFKVTSKVDSRTILDAGGADQLIGRGDMLLSQGGDLIRLQCPFVDTPEVEKIAQYIGDQMGYPTPYELPEYVDPKESGGTDKSFDSANKDELFEEAARLIVRNQIGSTSLIQRKLALGYARSGRLMDQLEAVGIVGPNLGSKAREVYIKTEEELERILQD